MTESTATTEALATQTLEVPGATLTYDVRRNESSTEPILVLIGSPKFCDCRIPGSLIG